MNLSDLPLLLTVDEFAELVLRADRKTGYGVVGRGEIRSIRVGRLVKIPRAAVAEYLGESDPGPPRHERGPADDRPHLRVLDELDRGEGTSTQGREL